MTHPNLEFSKESVGHLQYGFPMVYEDRQEAVSSQFIDDFETTVNNINTKNQKLIVATHTTMKGVNQSGLSNLLDALTQIKDTVSIVSVGNQYSENLRNKYISNGIYIYRSIPQMMALQKADLCINHGGIHTINECIHYKTPMVILSGNKHDQNGCAVRVSHFGCGISSCANENSVSEIVSYIKEVMSNSTYRSKIEALNESYKKAKEENVFEKYVEHFISSRAQT